MLPRATIFDSASEKELFHSISGAWEPRYHVYPHIPFTNLIDLDPQTLDAAELSFLHKTTVDYVVVEGEGLPLLAIEFDGLGHGISRHGRYVQRVATKRDPNRAWKLDLKVRVAKRSGFPFLVVSYNEKAVIEEETNLTILQGIVGHFIAGLQIGQRVQDLIAENQGNLDEMSESERHDSIQDMAIVAEVEAEMEYNPITRRAAELSTILARDYGVSGYSCSYLEDPPRPEHCGPWNSDFNESVFREWWNNIDRLGCEHRIKTPNGEIARTVWIRNFDGSGVSPFGFLEELAQLVACQAALVEMRNSQ